MENDGIAFRNNWSFVVPVHDFHTWSETNRGRKPKHFIGFIDINLYDFIWSRITDFDQQEFILSILL